MAMDTNIRNRKLAEDKELKKSEEISKSIFDAASRNGFRLCNGQGLVSPDCSFILLDVFGRKWTQNKKSSEFNNIVGLVKPFHWPIIRRLFVGKWIAAVGFYPDEILIAVYGEKNCSDHQLEKFLDEFQEIIAGVLGGRRVHNIFSRNPAPKARWKEILYDSSIKPIVLY